MSGEVESEVAETVAPESVETPSGASNEDILSKLDGLEKLLTDTLASAGNGAPAPAGEVAGEVEEPSNNEVIRDKSPASKPWTHKRILK